MASTTLVGNITADPELKTTQDGTEFARFTVAWSERQKSGDDWIDGPVTFVRCTVWGRMAAHVANNLRKGNRVIVAGDMRAEEWASDKGPQTDVVMNVRQIGASIEFHDVTITKRERTGGSGAFGQQSQQPKQQGGQPSGWIKQDAQQGFQNNATDPWNSAPKPNDDEEAPF